MTQSITRLIRLQCIFSDNTKINTCNQHLKSAFDRKLKKVMQIQIGLAK